MKESSGKVEVSLAEARPSIRPKGPRAGRGRWKISENLEQPAGKVGAVKVPVQETRGESASRRSSVKNRRNSHS